MDRNEALIRERKLRGWSQGDVATRVGTGSKTVSAWECGQATPSAHFQLKLCELFGKNAMELGFVSHSPIIIASHLGSRDNMSITLDQLESIIDLAWEMWFASKPEIAQREMLKVLPRLDQIRYSSAVHLHALRAKELLIRVHGLLGAVYLDGMENNTALHHYVQAQGLAAEIHNIDQSTTYLALIGDVLRRKDRKLEAISRMELAREQASQGHTERATRGHILQLLAYTYADVGNAQDFESTIEEATNLLGHAGEGQDAASKEFIPFEVLEIRGKAMRDLGRPLEAIQYLELAEKSLDGQFVPPRWHALLKISKAQAFCDAGDLAIGIDLAERGLLMAQACASPRQANRVRKLWKKLKEIYGEDKRVKGLGDMLYDCSILK